MKKEELKVLAVIPARGGSKGVPKKNIKNLNGKPMLYYMLDAARKSKLLDKIIVSTESEEIAQVAKDLGAEVPFLRPKEMANDTISVTVAAKHAMEFFDRQGEHFDAVISLQVTNPLTLPEDIDACVQKMLDTDCDSVLSMKVIEDAHPWRIYDLKGDKVLPFNSETNENFPQRQDRPVCYKFSGAFFMRKRILLEQWNSVDFALGDDRRGVLIPYERSVDINVPLDFAVAEALLKEIEANK